MARVQSGMSRSAAQPLSVPQVPVLGYHHVHDGPDDFFRTWPDTFARQLETLLSEGYEPLTPAQLLALAQGEAQRRHALVTFDDAYVDFATHAWPILRALRVPATLFVISDKIGGWNDWDDIRWAPHAHLDAAALRRLHAEGAVIGSHTRTHRPLVRLEAHELESELRGSRDALAALIEAPVDALAYPGGATGDAVRACAARFYELAFATDAPHDGARCDAHQIARFDPCFHGDLDSFRRALDARCGLGR